MYKVFVNDKPIILTDSLKSDNNFPLYIFKEIVVDELIHKLQSGNEIGVNLFCSNLSQDWQIFQKSFKVRYAAGGLVQNKQQKFLFIFRGGKWDLPKGGVEKGETIEEAAVREVEEECGIKGLEITHPLLTTYHVFYQNKKQLLKITDWFMMQSSYTGKLSPQLEEGITKAVFKTEKEVQQALKKCYANIVLIYKKYQELRLNG